MKCYRDTCACYHCKNVSCANFQGGICNYVTSYSTTHSCFVHSCNLRIDDNKKGGVLDADN